MQRLTETQKLLLTMMRQGARVVGNASPRFMWRIEPESFNRDWLEMSKRPVQSHTLAGLHRRNLVERISDGGCVVYRLKEGA